MIERYTMNVQPPSQYAELGILQFGKDWFPARFTDKPAMLHYEMAIMLFQLMNPRSEFSFERQRYMLVHREAAKSTFGSFLLPIFLIFMKGHTIYVDERMLTWDPSVCTIEDHFALNTRRVAVKILIEEHFIVIASETARRAERFVNSLKIEVETRADMASLFGEKDPRVIDLGEDRRKTNKVWRVNSFVTKDNTVVFGIGAGQRIRGENEGGKRPTLIIVDDMYSGQNVKTDTNRENSSYWFHAELLNSLDSKQGKCLWLGTMVHPDTVVKDFRIDDNWKGVERPIVGVDDLKMIVDKFTNNEQFIMPSKSVCEDLNIQSLSWKERHPLYSILSKYYKHLRQNKLNYFYQEFMNEALAPELKFIGPQAFYVTDIEHHIEDDRNIIEFSYDGFRWIGTCDLYVGLDPAASEATTSDDTVICLAGLALMFPRTQGMDYMGSERGKGKLFPIIMHIEGGKYSIRPYQNLNSMGVSLVQLDKRYIIKYINIESNGQQEHIVREVRTYLNENKAKARIYGEPSFGKKSERIINTVLPIVHKYKTVICNGNEVIIAKLYNQLLTVGISDHDDYPDALSLAWKNMREPEMRTYYDEGRGFDEESKKIGRWELLQKEYGDDAWAYL